MKTSFMTIILVDKVDLLVEDTEEASKPIFIEQFNM